MVKVLNSINNILLFILLAFGLLFGPFGIYIIGISLNKLLLFLLLTVCLSIFLCSFKISKTSLLVALVWLFFLAWFSLLLPLLKDGNSVYALAEVKSFLWSLLIIPIAMSYKNGGLEKIFASLFYIVIFVSLVICVVFITATSGFPEIGYGLRLILGFFSVMAGSETDNIFIGPMPDGSFRVMWIFSLVLPFYLFWIIDNYIGSHKFLFILVILIALIASGSRALLGVTAFIFVLKYAHKIKLKYLFGIIPLLTVICIIIFPKVSDSRIFSIAEDFSSKSVRGNQIAVLISEFSKAPLIGNGLGFYSNEAISNEAAPFSYEFVYLSLLTKVGLFGILVLFVLIFFIFKKNRLTKSRLLLFIAFVLITSTNPFLWSLLGIFCLCMSFYYPLQNPALYYRNKIL